MPPRGGLHGASRDDASTTRLLALEDDDGGAPGAPLFLGVFTFPPGGLSFRRDPMTQPVA